MLLKLNSTKAPKIFNSTKVSKTSNSTYVPKNLSALKIKFHYYEAMFAQCKYSCHYKSI